MTALEVKDSQIPGAGLGLYANKDFNTGDTVAELTGEILSIEEANERSDNSYMFR